MLRLLYQVLHIPLVFTVSVFTILELVIFCSVLELWPVFMLEVPGSGGGGVHDVPDVVQGGDLKVLQTSGVSYLGPDDAEAV